MRIERWYWLAVFCLVSLGIHLGLVYKSRSFGTTPLPPRPAEIEVALEPLPQPKPLPEREPPPRKLPEPKPKTPQRHPLPARIASPRTQPIPQRVLVKNTPPDSTRFLKTPTPPEKRPIVLPTEKFGGFDPHREEKPMASGLPVPATTPRIARTRKPDFVPGGGGSPAPGPVPGGNGGAKGPETPPDEIVYNGGGAGGIQLPKAAPRIGGGGGKSILSVDTHNPLAEAVPEERPGVGPGTGSGEGLGRAGGVGYGHGRGIGTQLDGKAALAALHTKPGAGIGAGKGTRIGTRAPGGGKGTGSELPGTGGSGLGYGRGSGIGIGSGAGSGVGDGGGLPSRALTRGIPLGDIAGILSGGKTRGGGGVGGGPGGPGRGNRAPTHTTLFGGKEKVPYALKGDIYFLPENAPRLPDFSQLTPVGSIYATELNVPRRDFSQGFPGVTNRFEWFAIDYNGKFVTSHACEYRFRITSDDGSKLFIDDQLVIDNDGQHGVQAKDGSMNLKQGIHKIRVQYFQGPRFEVALVLEIAGEGEDFLTLKTDETN